MNDTIKTKRPPIERKQRISGRVEHDPRGNAVWVRSRATDLADLPLDPALSIVDEGTASILGYGSARDPAPVKPAAVKPESVPPAKKKR